jgi:dihydroorotate dehydrogenase (NAD+) catalytic subunit
VKIPIVGIGGISSAADALEFIIAGATAVAVGTANFTEPATAVSVIEGMEAYLVRRGMKSISELVGSLRV